MAGNEVIEVLEELIKTDSRNPFKIGKKNRKYYLSGNETKINNILSQKLKEAGFKVEKQFVHEDLNGKKYYNILGEKGSGDNSILFYGHSDTVSSQPWKSKKSALTPKAGKVNFQGKNREVILGLGSNDMKAGLAVISTAFKNIDPVGYKIKVAFGADEEFYSLGANVLAQNTFMDDVKAVVVPEIGDGPNKFYGYGTIGIGRLGRCEFELDFFGTGGHGAISGHPTFINAAVEASKFCVEFEKFRKDYRDVFRFNSEEVPDKFAVDEIEGSMFISKIDCGNESLSIPSSGRIVIDCTFTPLTNIGKLRGTLKHFIAGLYKKKILKPVTIEGNVKKAGIRLKDRPTPYSEAYLTPSNDRFTNYVRECVNKVGRFRNYNMGYSVADENVFRRYNPEIPVIICGPVGWNSHRADEWVEKASVKKLYDLYTELGKNFNDYLMKSI